MNPETGIAEAVATDAARAAETVGYWMDFANDHLVFGRRCIPIPDVDTTWATLTGTLKMLAQHPDVLDGVKQTRLWCPD